LPRKHLSEGFGGFAPTFSLFLYTEGVEEFCRGVAVGTPE